MSAPDAPILSSLPTRTRRWRCRRSGTARRTARQVRARPGAAPPRAAHAIERKRAESALAHQALHDPLTGLPNRALFLDRLGVALDRSRRSGGQLAVLFLDVDNFKQINDSLGHAAGDRLLGALAERFSTLLRPMDTVARFGGDEFTFLFEGLTSEREVVLIAERISQSASCRSSSTARATVTVSIGIAMVADPTVPRTR